MKRKLLAMIVTYATSAGAIWGAVEAYTYFEGESLKRQLGSYWPLLFVVLPGILAIIAGLRTDSKKPQEAEVKRSLRVVATGDLPGKDAQKSHEEHVAEADLMLAFHKWWASIKDYEESGAEMVASASEAGLVPRSPEMGIQLGNFEVVKIKRGKSLLDHVTVKVTGSAGIDLDDRDIKFGDSFGVIAVLNITLDDADFKALAQSNNRFFNQSGLARARRAHQIKNVNFFLIKKSTVIICNPVVGIKNIGNDINFHVDVSLSC